MRRRPEALPLLAIAALPFRLPISADGRTVNLLIPLYLVVAAGTLTLLVPSWLGRRRIGASSRPESPSAGPPGPKSPTCPAEVVAILCAVDHCGMSASEEPPKSPPGCPRAAWNGCCSGPSCCTRCRASTPPITPRRRRTSRSSTSRSGCCSCSCATCAGHASSCCACLGVAVALAVVFAGIGFVEYYRKTLFLNPKVVAANQYDNYFRVNSLFFDPSIYGRFLAIVMIAVTTVVLWSAPPARRADRRGRARVAAGGAGHELLAVEHRGAAARDWRCSPPTAGTCARRYT